MSRYLVDKFIYTVDRDDAWLERYHADSVRCLAEWESSIGHVVGAEKTSGHAFTDAERAAIVAKDWLALYRMGAHPFILWTLFIPLLQPDHATMKELQEAYATAISEFGRPDFRT